MNTNNIIAINRKVVSINRKNNKNFSGFSAYSAQGRNSLEEIFLSIGSLASLAVLQIICIAAFSFPQSILFVIGAVIGGGIGFVVYKYFPAQIESYFNLQEAQPNTMIEDIYMKKAA